jgi:hypothetical protein
MTEDRKKRYYPNFFQQRYGNTIYLLTEVMGGKIIRREFKLKSDSVIHEDFYEQRQRFLDDAAREVSKRLSFQTGMFDAFYDGTPYTLENLPDGIGILDVMTEIRIADSLSDKVTEEDIVTAINAAVERKRAKK